LVNHGHAWGVGEEALASAQDNAMEVVSTGRPPATQSAGCRLALAVADANWYTTENLFGAIKRTDVSTLLLKCIDYYNAWQRGLPPWAWRRALHQVGPGLWEHDLVLPSGWMKRFPSLGMRPIERSIHQWRSAHAGIAPLVLVMTYPHYLYLRDMVRPDLHVYFNVDDYSQYWPRFASQVNVLERQAVREADLTVCVSSVRADELRAAIPEAADKIRHLPHGSTDVSLSDHPWERPAPAPDDLSSLPRPLLGYVGTLEDRADWELLIRLSVAFPRASIAIVGPSSAHRRGAWYAEFRRFAARPNVHLLGKRPQGAIHRYNRAFDVCLIPYRTDHPFNKVCSPTKIMDYMGTGRPIVSTALPECRLYEGLFHVASSNDEFIAAVGSILAAGSDDGRSSLRFDWARANTCGRVVERFLDWLPL
jgi:teichuronic acid biosynthesis glycosyltransferase TuaH